jgi:hypothetical protein
MDALRFRMATDGGNDRVKSFGPPEGGPKEREAKSDQGTTVRVTGRLAVCGGLHALSVAVTVTV